MADQMYPGLLSQFGLDINEKDLRERDLLKRQQTGLALAGNLGYQGPAAASAQAGALFAAALGNRGYKPSTEENGKIKTAKEAGDLMNQWLAANPDAKEKDKGLIYQKLLAESAFRNGLPDIGSQAMQGYEQAKMVREEQEKNLEGLGYRVNKERVASNMAEPAAEEEKKTWGRAARQAVWPMGSNDPNDSMVLQQDADGNMLDGSGNVVLRLGEYTTNAPLAGKGGDGGEDMLLTPSAAEGYRQTQKAAIEMMDGIEKLDNILLGAQKRDGKIDILGWGGNLASQSTEIADNMASAMSNVAKAFGIAPGEVEVELSGELNDDGTKKYVNARSGAAALVDHYETEVNAAMSKYIPESLRKTGADAKRARQNLMNITYAIMRAKEPGNNRYSDADFKNAMELAGAGIADPEKLRATLYDRVQEATKSYDISRMQIDPRMHGKIWGKASTAYFEGRRKQFEDRFGKYAVGTQSSGSSGGGGRKTIAPKLGEGEWSLVP